MRKVEHSQDAKDDGQAARHQKQQQSVQHAVERGYDDQFKHDIRSSKVRVAFAPAPAVANDELRDAWSVFNKNGCRLLR